jgi:predicted transcriptional regulator
MWIIMWILIHIGPASMKTIQMTIDPHLLKAVDKLTRQRKTTRSALIRTALEAELRRERVNELEARHASGYASRPAAPGEFDAWTSQQDWGT